MMRSKTAITLRRSAESWEDNEMAKDKNEYEVTMTFDGEEVGMMPFVEGMVRDVVLGLAENLKGYEEGKEIVIRIK